MPVWTVPREVDGDGRFVLPRRDFEPAYLKAYPAWKAKTDSRYASIDRRVHPEEMAEAFRAGGEAGLWRFDDRWREIPARQILLQMVK